MPEPSRQLAAIMFTDIVGNTALITERTDEIMKILIGFLTLMVIACSAPQGKISEEANDLYVRAQNERMNYWESNEKKYLEKSHDLLDQALQIDPEFVQAIVGKGKTFMAEKRYDSALFYADRAIALDPEIAGGYGLKGECFFLMPGLNELAIENFLMAIDLPDEDGLRSWYHVALGRVYSYQKNDLIKAFPHFNKALKMGSLDAGSYAIIGGSYFRIGDYERSGKYLSKSLELGATCNGFGNYNRLLMVQGKFQQALQFTDSICEEIACRQQCYRHLFEESLLLEEFENAEQYFYEWQKVRQESSWNPNRHSDYQIGYVYYRLGKTKEAENTFTEQIQKLQSIVNRGRGGKYDSLHLSRIFAFQSERDKALQYLAGYAQGGFHNGWHDFILMDPFFESLRDDPEFQIIVKRAQEEKAALRAQVREMEERGELDL